MSKTTSYAMYPHSVIGFGFAIDGFKLFAHLEAKAFKTKLCVHTSCGVALPDTQGVSSGRFLRAREIGKAVHAVGCGRTALALECSCTRVSSAFKNNTSLSANLAST